MPDPNPNEVDNRTPQFVQDAIGQGAFNAIGDDVTNMAFLGGLLTNAPLMLGLLGGTYGLRKLFGLLGGQSKEDKIESAFEGVTVSPKVEEPTLSTEREGFIRVKPELVETSFIKGVR